MINQELSFKSHIDSFQNLFPIINGVAVVGSDTIKLRHKYKEYRDYTGFYADKIQTYLLYQGKDDSLMVILHFSFNRLFEVAIYAKGSYYVNNLNLTFHRTFKNLKINAFRSITSDSTVKYADRIVTYGERYESVTMYGENKKVEYYFSENYITNSAYLSVADRKTKLLIPYWCGYGNKGRSWKKVKEYLNK